MTLFYDYPSDFNEYSLSETELFMKSKYQIRNDNVGEPGTEHNYADSLKQFWTIWEYI